MKWRKVVRWPAVALGIFVIVLAGGVVFLKSYAFRQYLLRKVEEQAAQSTGGRVQIGAVDFKLAPLTMNLRNIVVRGTESASDSPLLQVDGLTVGVSLKSLLGHKINLTGLLIQHPVLHLRTNSSGTNNLPQGPPSQSHTSVFDLAIAHLALTDGEIVYNDTKTPLNITLDDLRSEVNFHSASVTYKGFLSYTNGRFRYARYPVFPHTARIQFSATPTALAVESASLTTGSSIISLRGDIRGFDIPAVNADYDIHLEPKDFSPLSAGLKAAGEIHLAGSVHYANVGARPLIQKIAIGGRLAGNRLSVATSGRKVDLQTFHADYELENGSLQVSDFAANVLGGQVTANATIRDLDATPASEIRVALHNISLHDIQNSTTATARDQVAIRGTLAGAADASWKGSVQNIRARADLTVLGGAKHAHNTSGMIPLDATIHGIYDGPRCVLTVRQSIVRAPSLTLTADGEISRSSSLKIHGQVDDLHQLLQIASSFSSASTNMPAISGSATLDSTVQGSIRSPQISGRLTAASLHLQGSDWKSAAMTFTASPSGVAISNGTLVNGNEGRASFAADIRLNGWHYDANNPISGELALHRIAISDVQQVANVQYPISGDLSAQISVTGTQLDPSGSGSLEIANARVYGEPLQTAKLKFNAANGSISSRLNIAASAGSATTTFTYIPKTRVYQLDLDAPTVALQKLNKLDSSHGLSGTISVSAHGEGTLDHPQLIAAAKVAQLKVRQKSLGEINANMQLADALATLNLDSQLSQSPIHAHAQVHMTGDFQTDAAIDTGPIPLEALWTTFSSGAPEGFHGQTELHATLKGPLKDRSRIEAHVNIPTLSAGYQELQIAAAGPIRADYVHSLVALQPIEIRGTDTALRLQGEIPLAGSAAPSLAVTGQIDMKILRMLAPDLQSSGIASIDLHAAGSRTSPALEGQIRLRDIGMAYATSPLAVGKLNGVLNVDSNRVQLSDMTAQVGSGQFSLGGAITYRPNLQFALLMQGKSIRLRYPQGLRSELDSTLNLSGNGQAATLNGRILVDSLSFTPDFDLGTFADQFTTGSATPPQPGLADNLRLNVSVQSKQNLSATSSQVSLEGRVDLNVTGTAAGPVITGRSELTSGELFYRSNRYQLQRGVITFANPNQTNPNLNLSVTTTVEQYNLTINLHGTLDRLATSYSSDPPLSTTDIIHLIAFGSTSSESAASNASQSTDAMVASSAVGAGLTSGVQKLAGFSSLQIDPLLGGSNQNPSARIALQQRVTRNFLFTFSTDVSQPGEEIVQGDYQISPRWSVNVTRDQLGGVTVAGRLHTKF